MMSILFAGLLLGVFGLLVMAAPKRKRYRRWHRRPVGDSSIDGEEDCIEGGSVADLGVFGSDGGGHHGAGHHHHGGHDVGVHHGGHDVGGHSYGGDSYGGDSYGGGHDSGGGHH